MMAITTRSSTSVNARVPFRCHPSVKIIKPASWGLLSNSAARGAQRDRQQSKNGPRRLWHGGDRRLRHGELCLPNCQIGGVDIHVAARVAHGERAVSGGAVASLPREKVGAIHVTVVVEVGCVAGRVS